MMIRNVLVASVLAVGLAVGLTGFAFAGGSGELKTYTATGAFDDVNESVADAILNRGFVIDYHGFVGNMLKRTGKELGSSKVYYKDAEFYQFCSAKLTRTAVAADPGNIGFCPYVVVVYELESAPGIIKIGYRPLPQTGPAASKMALGNINAVLDGIVREATMAATN
ncbi:MAG: DUF302 domain-containing protein [Alphaproteobacteria bacterium]|jgi:hypothetical protein|nr:DUF302 domain-containing protein [Alphaproteobacteria bacterium]MBT7943000.1 DUF302 domain-containing protein [Alphaproteobacteria bacterium]